MHGRHGHIPQWAYVGYMNATTPIAIYNVFFSNNTSPFKNVFLRLVAHMSTCRLKLLCIGNGCAEYTIKVAFEDVYYDDECHNLNLYWSYSYPMDCNCTHFNLSFFNCISEKWNYGYSIPLPTTNHIEHLSRPEIMIMKIEICSSSECYPGLTRNGSCTGNVMCLNSIAGMCNMYAYMYQVIQAILVQWKLTIWMNLHV